MQKVENKKALTSSGQSSNTDRTDSPTTHGKTQQIQLLVDVRPFGSSTNRGDGIIAVDNDILHSTQIYGDSTVDIGTACKWRMTASPNGEFAATSIFGGPKNPHCCSYIVGRLWLDDTDRVQFALLACIVGAQRF